MLKVDGGHGDPLVHGLTWLVLLSRQMKAELLVRVVPGEATEARTGNVHLSPTLR